MEEIRNSMKKAASYIEKKDNECAKILHKLEEILEVPEDAGLDFVSSDGFCLIWAGDTFMIVYNTPINNILDYYKKVKRKITKQELKML